MLKKEKKKRRATGISAALLSGSTSGMAVAVLTFGGIPEVWRWCNDGISSPLTFLTLNLSTKSLPPFCNLQDISDPATMQVGKKLPKVREYRGLKQPPKSPKGRSCNVASLHAKPHARAVHPCPSLWWAAMRSWKLDKMGLWRRLFWGSEPHQPLKAPLGNVQESPETFHMC